MLYGARRTGYALCRKRPVGCSAAGESCSRLAWTTRKDPRDHRQLSEGYLSKRSFSYSSSSPARQEVIYAPVGSDGADILPGKKVREITQRIGSTFSGHHRLQWAGGAGPRTVLFVFKQGDQACREAVQVAVSHIRRKYPRIRILIAKDKDIDDHEGGTASLAEHLSEAAGRLTDKLGDVDLVVAIGGDGTILNTSRLFDQSSVPPVLSFTMGSLGFLLPFHFSDFATAFDQVMTSEHISLTLRMRLSCSLHNASGEQMAIAASGARQSQVMNEVTLHRGRFPHLTNIDTFVNGQFLTEAVADGLLIATPTGSTAYSLAAGGPIVHPSLQSLLLTAISPRSLSFRTLLLPPDSTIQLRCNESSRAPLEVSMDGQAMSQMGLGDYLQISMSKWPIPCIDRPTPVHADMKPSRSANALNSQTKDRMVREDTTRSSGDAWAQDLVQILGWNKAFINKRLLP